VTESSGNIPEPSPAAMHQMHSQPGLFAIHSELLTVIVMQPGGSCNMTTSLVADDPNAYMVKMCSPGYYGPLCSLCLLHNAPPGEARYGRTGNLNCQKCRCVSALSCSLLAVLHHVVCAGLGLLLLCCSHLYLQFCSVALPILTVCCVVLLMYISC